MAMIPAKTFEVVGSRVAQAMTRFNPNEYYVLTGTDLNDLGALAMRVGTKSMTDANENRDWENRLNLMVNEAHKIGPMK